MIQQNQELEHKRMSDNNKDLLNFWEDQMKQSHTSSNYFFRKSPSHYHMMLASNVGLQNIMKNCLLKD